MISICSIPGFSDNEGKSATWNWSGVERVVVVADIHGAYAEFTALLRATGVVDAAMQWIGGETHLVSLGDLLDRGARSRDVMDLLMRLQEEARQQGGRVHVVAGNHDVMNLLGDLRYVSLGEFAAYSDLESSEQRASARAEFSRRRNPDAGQKFENLYPPGYFGHRRAFAPDGYYGRWLLSLPVMITVNGNVFVHGGLSPITTTAAIDELNRRYHAELSRYFILWRRLADAGIFIQDAIQTDFTLLYRALRVADPRACPAAERRACHHTRRRATDRQRDPSPELLAALKELAGWEDYAMLGATGPLWYRGSVGCKDVLEMPLLQSALTNLAADRVVVGHTPTRDRRVHEKRGGRLIMLDTGMLVSRYRGRPAALVIESDNLVVQYLNPEEKAVPLRGGGVGAYPLSYDQLQEALRSGKIHKVKKGWMASARHIELIHQGVRLHAQFFPANPSGSHKRELAAYRINELLGFDLVPVTVRREIDGKAGTLQLKYRPVLFVTESERLQQRINFSGWCPLATQSQLLAVYDLLIGNDRSRTTMGYVQPHWDLQAFGHGKAFSLTQVIPAAARKLLKTFELPAVVWESLASLDETNLSEAAGQQLEADEIEALLARRDAILRIIGHPVVSYDHPERAATGNRHR